MPVFDDDDLHGGERSYSGRRGTRRGSGSGGSGGGGGGGGGGRGGGHGGGDRGGHGGDYGGGHDPEDEWSVEDEGPDDRDLVPDEMPTVRCTHCRKLIFEDLVRCPYCRELQLEERQNKKPLWFVVTVIFCVIASGGVAFLWLLNLLFQ